MVIAAYIRDKIESTLPGTILTISDFNIDGDLTYLLLNNENSIIVANGESEKTVLDFNKSGSTVIRFAVKDNHIWTYDNCGNIISEISLTITSYAWTNFHFIYFIGFISL